MTPRPPGLPGDATDTAEHTRRFAACAVHLSAAGRFIGSGFLVAPGLVATCAHVPGRAAAAELAVHHGALRHPVRRVDFAPLLNEAEGERFYAFPDLAVIRVPQWQRLPTAELAAADPAGGHQVTAFGYSRYTPVHGTDPEPSTLLLKVAGVDGPFIRVIDDEVKDGLSGSMVVGLEPGPNQGRVCGVVKGSRDFNGVRGGWITPVSALRQLLDTEFPGELRAPSDPAAPAVRELSPEDEDRLVDLLVGIRDGGPRFRETTLSQMGRYLGLGFSFPAPHADTAREHWTLVVDTCRSWEDRDLAFHVLGRALGRLRPGEAVVGLVQALLGGEW